MLKADMIPPDAMYAAWKAMNAGMTLNEAIAAALNAWPFGAVCHYTIKNTEGWELVLPLPQEKTDE